ILGVAFALLLDRKFLGRGVVRTLIITPFLVMPAAAAVVWAGPMLDPSFGLLNYLLQPFGIHHVAWLSSHALGSVIVVIIWQWTPFMTLIVLAGLQGQPADTLEAAKVDGAGALATFRELTLPHLRPYIELGILLGSIYLVNTFDAVRLMTNGGPGTSTTNLPFYLYQQVNSAFDVGGAAATGVVTVVLTIIVAPFALRMFARGVRVEEAWNERAGRAGGSGGSSLRDSTAAGSGQAPAMVGACRLDRARVGGGDRVLPPGAVDGDHSVQAGGRRRDLAAQVHLQPHAVGVPPGLLRHGAVPDPLGDRHGRLHPPGAGARGPRRLRPVGLSRKTLARRPGLLHLHQDAADRGRDRPPLRDRPARPPARQHLAADHPLHRDEPAPRDL